MASTEEFAFLKGKISATHSNSNLIEFIIRKSLNDFPKDFPSLALSSTSTCTLQSNVSSSFLIQVEKLAENEISIMSENDMDEGTSRRDVGSSGKKSVVSASLHKGHHDLESAACIKCKSRLLVVVDDGTAVVVTSLCCKVLVWHFEKSMEPYPQSDLSSAPPISLPPKEPLERIFKVDGGSSITSSADQTMSILEMLQAKKKKKATTAVPPSKKTSKIPATFASPIKGADSSSQPPALPKVFSLPLKNYQSRVLDVDWYYRPYGSEITYDDDDDEGEAKINNVSSTEAASSHEMELLRKYLNDSDLNSSGADLAKLMAAACSKSDKLSASHDDEYEEYEVNPLKTTMSFTAFINKDQWARESIIKYGGDPLWVHDVEDDELASEKSCSCSSGFRSTRFVFQLLPYLWQVKFDSLSATGGQSKISADTVCLDAKSAAATPWSLDWSSIYYFQCLECHCYFSITQSL